jgi:hypothetical protein
MSFNENKSNREAFIFKAYSLILCIVRSIFYFQYVKKKNIYFEEFLLDIYLHF